MMKSISLLVIGILIVDVVVITGSFMQQSGKLTEAGANVSVLESQVTALNGELVTLRGSVAVLQSRLADSESKSSNLQAKLTAAEANATALQTKMGESKAKLIQQQAPVQTPIIPAPMEGNEPAFFTTSNLEITPGRIEPGNKASIVVTVTNTGGQAGIYKVVLTIDGQITKTQDTRTQDVTLAAGTSQNVSFVLLFSQEDTYAITVGNLSDLLIVEDRK
ncbi:MAG: CARDB domain-containing protein [Dehalococcoidales bacterium]|nr:CARDB domain-containing protein [Dehalococcoidales bacterium]